MDSKNVHGCNTTIIRVGTLLLLLCNNWALIRVGTLLLLCNNNWAL